MNKDIYIQLRATDSIGKDWQFARSGKDFKEVIEAVNTDIENFEMTQGLELDVNGGVVREGTILTPNNVNLAKINTR